MTFAFPLPSWAMLLAAAALVLLAHAAYRGIAMRLASRERAVLVLLRSVTLLLLGVFLLRPMVPLPPGRRDAVVPVLVDVSPSMGIRDEGGHRRLDRVATVLRDRILPALASRYEVEVLAFSDAVAPAHSGALELAGRRTDLAGALEVVRQRYGGAAPTNASGRAVAGIVLLSDGVETAAGDAARAAARGPAVFPVTVASAPARDRAILSVSHSDTGAADGHVRIAVSSVSRGFGPSPYDVRLVSGRRVIGTRRVMPSGDGIPVSTVFTVGPDSGSDAVLTAEVAGVAVPPRDGPRADDVPLNDRASVLPGPAGRLRRVLFVQGAPGFEHTFLLRALTADRGLRVDAVARNGRNDRGEDVFLVQAPAERGRALAAGYPRTPGALFAYDVVVFGNEEWERLAPAQLQMTADFVGHRGGGLVVLGAQSLATRGLADSPLAEVLPLEPTPAAAVGLVAVATSGGNGRGVTAVLTDEGRDHPATRLAEAIAENEQRWASLPALAGAASVGSPKPGASVLAVTAGDGRTRPLLAVQRFGMGRSLVFAGEASWRWKMQRPAADDGYDRFWRQAVRWAGAAARDPVSIEPVANVQPGDAAKVTIAVADAAFAPVPDATVTAEVSGPGGGVEVLKATLADGARGTYEVAPVFREAGVYRVRVRARRAAGELGTAEDAVLAGGVNEELAHSGSDAEALRRIAEASGGRLLTAEESGSLPVLLGEVTRAPAIVAARDAWHTPLAFLAVVALAVSEWALRRRWGLR